MAGTRANPFRGFVDMITELERARRMGMTGHGSPAESGPVEADAWAPPADIYAVGDDLVIRLDVAGVRGEDIEITLVEGVLTISGERRTGLPVGATVYACERRAGPFRRNMIVPGDVEQEHVGAMLDDGVVEITVAGAGATVAPERIPVNDRSRPQVLRGTGSRA